MFVGVYRIELHLPASRSLKAKRSVVNGLKTRLSQLGLSVAEVEAQELWQRCVLGASAVSADGSYLESLVQKIESICLRENRAQLLRVEQDILPFGD